VVVYTKADQLAGHFVGRWAGLRAYLIEGSIEALARPEGYIEGMQGISNLLYQFTEERLHAHEFLNAAESNFKSVSFSVISALGTEPHDGRLSVEIVPRRILDPVLWIMEKSFSGPERFFRRWWGW
jgi:hypothetical protein